MENSVIFLGCDGLYEIKPPSMRPVKISIEYEIAEYAARALQELIDSTPLVESERHGSLHG